MASRSYTNASRSGFASTKDTETSQPRFEAPENSSKMTSPYLLQSKKRKAVEYDGEDEFASALAQNPLAGNDEKARKKARKKKDPDEEKRSKRFRVGPPIGYLERLDRMTSQRMFLIDREKKISEDGTHEEEVFDLAGSTGNIYQITIGKVPRCSCPDNIKGNQCKHIIYVLVNVLKAREDLAYQLAFLSNELAEIFANAPATPQSSEDAAASLITDTGGFRKAIDGDCPVCVMEFGDSEDILWCKAACGNNIHRACFEQWARSKPGGVKCVYCRTSWKGDADTVKRINKQGSVNEEGYVNVASELGLSTQRDMSTYHQPWVNKTHRSRGHGYYHDHDEYD